MSGVGERSVYRRNFRALNDTYFNQLFRSRTEQFHDDLKLCLAQNSTVEIDDSLENVETLMVATLDELAPLKVRKLAKRRVPWLTLDLKSKIQQRDRLEISYEVQRAFLGAWK
ncbi:hypothetical protein PV327_008083 [Microctonus hyperodae]|uniref:Uncharacterized protein n=1 Tax=Microctonus hyperodae TaxID=165561 RepID=A0AA39KGI9_MICHY|nr:hypothetical protein PV327_008083 [Microctonus hyperodae]